MLPSAVKVDNVDEVRSESHPEDEEQGVVVSASMVVALSSFACFLSFIKWYFTMFLVSHGNVGSISSMMVLIAPYGAVAPSLLFALTDSIRVATMLSASSFACLSILRRLPADLLFAFLLVACGAISLCCTANPGIVPDSNKNAINRNMGRVGNSKDVSQLSSMSEPRDFMARSKVKEVI